MDQGLFRLSPVPWDGGPSRFALLEGTRSAFQVSEQVHEALTGQGLPGAGGLPEAASEIRRLRAMGFWPDDPSVWELSEQRFSLSLHLVHGCNLACPYCNVQQGTYGEPESLMSPETALAGVELLREQAGDRSMRLVFYGGEPLLNWPVMRRAVKRISSELPSCDLEVVTNGTLLNPERAAFLARHNVFTVISMDGPGEVHDRNRPMRAGGGSYDPARRGLECLKDAGAAFHIRATWVPGSEEYDRVLSHLAGLAGDERKVAVALEFEQAGREGVEAWNRVLCERFRAARAGSTGPPPGLGPVLDQVLRGDGAPVPRCEAGDAGISVTPDGTLYPCQVTASMKRFRLGTIRQGLDAEGRRNQAAFLGIRSEVCDSCWAGGLCGGPCPLSVPIPRDWALCRTNRLQVHQALEWAARTPSLELAGPFADDGGLRRDVERGAALRDLLWKRNLHIRPLALWPQPEQAR
ncbi:MAG: radical SAM protein [Deltaproteobacteria bacterium]|nr:radical SAM protein [Deltaproteobacteria bacterium]